MRSTWYTPVGHERCTWYTPEDHGGYTPEDHGGYTLPMYPGGTLVGIQPLYHGVYCTSLGIPAYTPVLHQRVYPPRPGWVHNDEALGSNLEIIWETRRREPSVLSKV